MEKIGELKKETRYLKYLDYLINHGKLKEICSLKEFRKIQEQLKKDGFLE